jgi:hypothetical protein
MNILELFNECTSGGWTTAGIDVQYKVIDETLFFQCSHGKSDWMYNFKASGDVYTNSNIPFVGHKGFNELWESVRNEIEKLSFSSIVGYSQGAAIAVRAHENFYHRKGFEPERTILFGCPPSIKKPSDDLRKRFTNVMNIYNYNDIVFHLPKLIGYSHVGCFCKLDSYKIKKPASVGLLEWLSGHSPKQYRQALEIRC